MIPDQFKKTIDDIDDLVMPFWSACGNSVVSMAEVWRRSREREEMRGSRAADAAYFGGRGMHIDCRARQSTAMDSSEANATEHGREAAAAVRDRAAENAPDSRAVF